MHPRPVAGRLAPLLLLLVVLAGLAGALAPGAAGACGAAPAAPPAPRAERPHDVRVLAWNIWRGGRQDGEDVGPAKVIDVIRDSGADVVAMQETYGSGERIAEALGLHLHARGTNVSILSRFPVLEDLSVHEPFNCVGALLQLPGDGRLAVFSVWLPYAGDIWRPGTRDPSDVEAMLAACRPSTETLAPMLAAIDARLADPAYDGVPLVLAGDLNAMSHLDYAEVARDQFGVALDWPTTRRLADAGWRDAYRETNPVIDRAADRTWSPRFPEQEADRIDFVFVRGPAEPVAARHLETHPDGFPSDHAAVRATLRLGAEVPAGPMELRAATANVRHGRGLDGEVDLDRTAAMLAGLEADVIALQEIDERAGRSGGVNQAWELGRRLGMHAAFGPFMDFDGGRYGMAVLSRFPIRRVRAVPLPDGHEPRVALAVEVRGPDGRALTIVNVHFDWVADDRFRRAQAEATAAFLRTLRTPFILLGDFNDEPGSPTLAAFDGLAREADKPADARLTWPAADPEVEIDFVLAGPPERWAPRRVRVIPETRATDHRPVVADLELRPAPARGGPPAEAGGEPGAEARPPGRTAGGRAAAGAGRHGGSSRR